MEIPTLYVKFIHLSDEYLLNAYLVTGTLLKTGDALMNKIKISLLT